MRCFLALDIDDACRQKLLALQAELRQTGILATYPKPEQMHVTLCFYGEITEKEVQEKKKALEALQQAAPNQFDVTVEGIGFFPSAELPRVAWAGFGEGNSEILKLQKEAARLTGCNDGKPFHPHVTLARIKRVPDKAALQKWAAGNRGRIATFRAKTVTLYESLLGPGGPAYEPLKKIALEEPPPKGCRVHLHATQKNLKGLPPFPVLA